MNPKEILDKNIEVNSYKHYSGYQDCNYVGKIIKTPINHTEALSDFRKWVLGKKKKETTPGKGCKCAAWGAIECACNVDWTDWNIYNQALEDLAKEME